MIHRHRSGFTLAEILITLIVIGIVAAYTIPVLIQSVNTAQFNTAFKKAYSDFSAASQRIKTDSGGNLSNYFQDSSDVKNKFLTYLSSAKECNPDSGIGVCWHNPDGWKQLNGTPINADWHQVPRAVMNNGSLAVFYLGNPSCDAEGQYKVCGQIFIDVNGFSSPNILGRDIFKIWITANGVLPMGLPGDSQEATCVSNNNGNGCAVKSLMNKAF